MKKLIALLLAMVMLFSLVACGETNNDDKNPDDANVGNNDDANKDNENPETPVEKIEIPDDPTPMANVPVSEEGPENYNETCDEIYTKVLGDFEKFYEEAVKETADLNRRYALFAQAEAFLLESGVMMPTATRGGSYAMSRVATRTVNSTLYGNDSDRRYMAVVCNELIKSEDQDALKALWAESVGTGTYIAKCKEYLTGKGYTLKDEHVFAYSGDPLTFDALSSSKQTEAEPIAQGVDGLMEYNVENMQVPALAESYEISEDGLTVTFKIRQGVKWVDQQGREVADVKADDWVAGLQHAFDTKGGLGDLVTPILVGAAEYDSGETTDFADVGVKALDDYTLQYTLIQPCPYFMSMLGYSVFWPMSRSYYESKGGKFGADFDSSAADYTYGKSPADIAYNGPFLITNYTEGNSFNFEANPTYWNKDALNVHSIKRIYDTGEDPTSVYNNCKNGVVDSCTLGTAVLTTSREEKPAGEDKSYYDLYHYTSATDATSFMNFFNLNRYHYANFNDPSVAVSPKTVTEAARAKAALQNIHFRHALTAAVDRAATRAPLVGEEVKYNALRNSYTPATFVQLDAETTVDINGTATTFSAGTFYGEIMQAQLDADGYPMQVWNAELASGDGYDGWYNPDYAVAELEKAIEELAAQGVEISAENPIYLDDFYPTHRENYTNSSNAQKQSIEAVLGGRVIINLVPTADDDQWNYAGYDYERGYQGNYDMNSLSGWGPDYGDPQTYLDTLKRAGYMNKTLGLY